MASPHVDDATARNRAYYGAAAEGQRDYWRKMAAPRVRLAVLQREVSSIAPASLVDVGCGRGALLEAVASKLPGAHLAGIDLSPELIASNRSRLPGLEWHVADFGSREAVTPSLAGRYECVVASEVIEHVADPIVFLMNARQLVPSGGTLLLSTQSGRVHETEREVGHVRHFTAEEMTAALRRSGWETAQVWNEGYPFHDLSKWWANRNPEASLERFGMHAYGWRENLICLLLRAVFRFNSRTRGAQLFAIARAAEVPLPGPSR